MTRPTGYTQELGDLICDLIAEGKSLRQIAAAENMPRPSTIVRWANESAKGNPVYGDFAEQYARAMDMRTDIMAEDIIAIADDQTEDEIFTEEGKRVMNSEFVQRSKVRIEARKWLMGKMKPKKYGDKQTVEHEGGATLTVKNMLADIAGE